MAITLVFTAANVYLGLKVGLTFASSIPAAVISMAILRGVRTATIQENNIVQTVASAAGTLSSIIFVLPGLVMVGWWSGFPFWESFSLCVVGGTLGVMYTIPLRRALVTESTLPYPEGVAGAEVLKVGTHARGGSEANIEGGRSGLFAVVGGSIASAGFAIITATRLFASEITAFWRIGPAATGFGSSLSLALLGAGHLVGLSVGIAMLIGLVIAWGFATPILSVLHPMAGPAADVATAIWGKQVRFIGAGAIGIAAIWTLGKLAMPVWSGLQSAIKASRLGTSEKAVLPRTEQDMPIGWVALISALSLVPIAFLVTMFLRGTTLQTLTIPLTVTGVAYIVVAGFLVAAICGYMAGLIGSSNSPLSGVGILTVIGASLVLATVAGKNLGADGSRALVALALFVTSIVFAVATIANDNLQDLKTGQLVDATPWKQQVALIFGVFAGALVIPPVLDLLNHAYGFAGAPNHGGISGSQPLPAPQATLISALAKGVLEGKLDWNLIAIGALIGAALIVCDEGLRMTGKVRVPPLAVGMGIYLPITTTFPIVIGALVGSVYDRSTKYQRDPAAARQLGVLLASGLIVGESLFGVFLAGLIVATGKSTPMALVGDGFQPFDAFFGLIAFAGVTTALYRWIGRLSRKAL
jgi:putative OPT family oligopeptide transporter